MYQAEYLSLIFSGSKGFLSAGDIGETTWDDVRLIVTQNHITTVQSLAGGFEKIEEHLTSHLTHYREKGWEPIRVERPEVKSKSDCLKKTIHCILKRETNLDSDNHFEPKPTAEYCSSPTSLKSLGW